MLLVFTAVVGPQHALATCGPALTPAAAIIQSIPLQPGESLALVELQDPSVLYPSGNTTRDTQRLAQTLDRPGVRVVTSIPVIVNLEEDGTTFRALIFVVAMNSTGLGDLRSRFAAQHLYIDYPASQVALEQHVQDLRRYGYL